MNPEKRFGKESGPEKREFGLYYKVDDKEERVYLGGNPEKLGEFLGWLDIKQNNPKYENIRERVEERIVEWQKALKEWDEADFQKREELIPGGQLNFWFHRVFIRDARRLLGQRILEELGLPKSAAEGKEEDFPKLVFQYLFNGDGHFTEIQETFEKIKAAMEKSSQEPAPENLDPTIEKLLETLESYGELYDGLSPELQDQWYDVEIGAKAGRDRQAAMAHLEEFIGVLEKIKTEKSKTS